MSAGFTICRPLLENVPEGAPGWTLTTCPYCGRDCWKHPSEPDPLPPGYQAACTPCALKRMTRQRAMDAKLAELGVDLRTDVDGVTFD